jgi:hypothetical protein
MYYVVVTVPTPEDAFPDLFHKEYYSDGYKTKQEALPELEEAKNDSRFIDAWIEFTCDDQCEECEFFDQESDICRLVYTDTDAPVYKTI